MGTTASFAWIPTTARVVTVDGFGPFLRGMLQTAPSPRIWPVKDPRDVLDYVVDYSEALAGDGGDGIATLDVSITPEAAGDLTLTTSRVDGTQAVLWLAAGVAGTNYAVTVVMGTNSGRSISRTISMPVASLSGPSAFTNVLMTGNGAPLTDQSGATLTTS